MTTQSLARAYYEGARGMIEAAWRAEADALAYPADLSWSMKKLQTARECRELGRWYLKSLRQLKRDELAVQCLNLNSTSIKGL